MIKLANKIALTSILGGNEGMEKKALNLASLLRMSRNAAKKGKLSRFSELLDKRNLAIDNVANVRANAANQQRDLADVWNALNGSTKAPEMKDYYQRMLTRSVAANGDPVDINRIMNLRTKKSPTDLDQFLEGLDLYTNGAGPWKLEDLAAYSAKKNLTKYNR